MTSNRFFLDKLKIKNRRIYLKGKEHHHLSIVLRKKRGDKIKLFDKEGTNYEAEIEEVTEKHTLLIISDQKAAHYSGLKITLAQTLLKSKKFDFILQKSTELGISQFVPIISSRTVMKIEEKTEKKMSRWNKIVLEAAKQSGQTQVPSIHFPVSIENYVKQYNNELCLFLNEHGGMSLRSLVLKYACSQDKKPPASVTLLCGPEGGWTEEEEKVILDSHFVAVSLGRYTLRSETAALSSIAVISLIWN